MFADFYAFSLLVLEEGELNLKPQDTTKRQEDWEKEEIEKRWINNDEMHEHNEWGSENE